MASSSTTPSMPTTSRGRIVLAEVTPVTRRRRWGVRAVLATLVAVLGYAGWAAYRGAFVDLLPDSCVATSGRTQVSLAPEQAANAATIAALSVKRGMPPRAATIAIATAMQESKLRNLRVGDRDSVGLFQQRPSQGWGSAEQILDPVYATNAFYDGLVKVKDYASRPLTEVAQQVQHSAYPEAYAQHEAEAEVWAAVLTGGVPEGLVCRLDPATSAGDPEAVRAALEHQVGTTAVVRGAAVAVDGAGGAGAWAAAAWAVAHAQARSVASVRVGDRVWSRSDADRWRPAPTPSAAGTGLFIVVTTRP